jgi:hypothetical protein
MQQRRDFAHKMALSSTPYQHNDDAYPEDSGKLDYTFGAHQQVGARFLDNFVATSPDDLRKAYDRDTLLMFKRIRITGRSSLSYDTDDDVSTCTRNVSRDLTQRSRIFGYSEEHETFPEEGIFVLEL